MAENAAWSRVAKALASVRLGASGTPNAFFIRARYMSCLFVHRGEQDLGFALDEVGALGGTRVEAHLVERPGGVGDFEPPGNGLEEASQHSEVVLPGGVGYAALVPEVDHV